MPLSPRCPRVLTVAAGLLLALAPTAPASASTPFPATIPLAAGSQPEGIAGGPGTTYFAGARTDGAIYTGDLRTGSRRLLVAGRDGAIAVGMRYEAATRRLWVAGGTTGAITAYDAPTGRELVRVDAGSGHFLNDVEVVNGVAYVTDSLSDQLFVVSGGKLSSLTLTGDYRPGGGFEANGIRALPGGDLVITQSSTGALLRVDRTTGVADRIELTGPALASGDGLELHGSALYVVYGFNRDSIAVVHLADGARTGSVTGELHDSDLDRPTTTTFQAGHLWTVNGRFEVPPTATTPYDVVRVDLR